MANVAPMMPKVRACILLNELVVPDESLSYLHNISRVPIDMICILGIKADGAQEAKIRKITIRRHNDAMR